MLYVPSLMTRSPTNTVGNRHRNYSGGNQLQLQKDASLCFPQSSRISQLKHKFSSSSDKLDHQPHTSGESSSHSDSPFHLSLLATARPVSYSLETIGDCESGYSLTTAMQIPNHKRSPSPEHSKRMQHKMVANKSGVYGHPGSHQAKDYFPPQLGRSSHTSKRLERHLLTTSESDVDMNDDLEGDTDLEEGHSRLLLVNRAALSADDTSKSSTHRHHGFKSPHTAVHQGSAAAASSSSQKLVRFDNYQPPSTLSRDLNVNTADTSIVNIWTHRHTSGDDDVIVFPSRPKSHSSHHRTTSSFSYKGNDDNRWGDNSTSLSSDIVSPTRISESLLNDDDSALWESSPPPERQHHDCALVGCQRIRLNVSGLYFETRVGVLNKHPTTLLGNAEKRAKYFDKPRREYFFDRHRPSFEAIFHYYQYGGKIKRPHQIPDDIFLSELEFYEIERDMVEVYKKDEGYVTENVTLPDNPLKRKIWMLFEFPETSACAFLMAIFSVVFTVVSIILFCMETMPRFSDTHCEDGQAPNFVDPFFILETMCTAWFTIEVVVRFLVCPSKKSFLKDVKNIIDVAAIVPYYVTLFNVLISFSCSGAKSSASLAFLRVIRLVRVFKLTKHSPGLQVLILTFRASIEGLGLFLVAMIVCVLVFSSTIYHMEAETKGSQIESIPDAFWWAIITMCTVGYGDKVPVSPLGKIVGGICAVAGVLTLAIPVPIITENFNKFYAHKTGRGRL